MWFTGCLHYGFGDALSSSGNTINSFRYVGEELNGFTNLYNLRARWYNQESGRFVSVDPFDGYEGSPVTLHRYGYANQSPISFNDPTGNFTLLSVMSAISVSDILAGNAIPRWVTGGQCRPLFISASHVGVIGDGDPKGQAFRHLRIRFHAAIRGTKENCVIEQFKKGTTLYGGGIYTDNIENYESDGGEWWNGNSWNPMIESEAKWNGGVATFYDYPGIYNINELSLPAERSMQYLTIIRDKGNKQSCKKIYWGIEMFISSDGSGDQYFYTGR